MADPQPKYLTDEEVMRPQPEAAMAIGPTSEAVAAGTAGLPAPHGVPQITIYPNIPKANDRPPIMPPAPSPNRISAVMGAFGQGWDEGTSAGEKLGLSDESVAWLQRVGVFKGKDDSVLSPLKNFNQLLIGGGAMMLDAALRTPGGIYRGVQGVLHEMGVSGDVVSLPDAFAGSPEGGMRPKALPEEAPPKYVPPLPGTEPSPIAPIEGAPNMARSELAKTGIPEVDRVLLSPVTRGVIDNPIVDRSRTIPYEAGGSWPPERPTTYVDKNVPKTMTVKRLSDPSKTITFDPAEPAVVHENTEEAAMEVLHRGGMRFDEAYRVAHFMIAEVAEHAWYRANDIDPEAAEAEWKKVQPGIQHEIANDVPKDLYHKEYPVADVTKARHEEVFEAQPTPDEIAMAMDIIRRDPTLGPVDRSPLLSQARQLGVIGPEQKPLNTMSPEEAGKTAQYGPRDPIGPARPGDPGGPPEKPSLWRQRLRSTFDKMDTPAQVREAMEKAIDETGDEFAGVRSGDLTPVQTAQVAEAFGLDPSEINQTLTGKLIKTNAQLRNAVELVRTADQKIKAVAEEIAGKDGKGDAEEVASLVKLRMQRDLIVQQALVPFVAIRAEFGRAGNVIQEFMQLKEPSQVGQFLKANGNKLQSVDDVRELAKLIANTDPNLVPSVMAEQGRTGPGKIYWTWVNGLISGIITHSKYVAANEAFSLWERGVVTPLAAVLNRARYAGVPNRAELMGGPNDKIFFGEAFAGVYGQIASVPLSFYAAAQSVKAGVRVPLEDEIQLYMDAKARGEKVPNPIKKSIDAFEQPQEKPIGGVAGRAIGLPGDVAGGIHFFYKLRGREAAMQSLAYRETVKEGYKPWESNFFRRMQWHYANPTDAMREQAIADAYRATFMSEQGEAAKAWARTVKLIPGGKWVFPFNHIPIDLMKRTYEGTPLAFVDKDMRADLTGKNGGAAESMAMARVIAGSSLMGYFTMLAMNGKATGDYPLDEESRNDWKATGKQPNSIMIGNEWVSFDKFGPAGSLASFGANLAQAVQRYEEIERGGGDFDDAMTAATFAASVAASRIMIDQVGWQSVDNMFKAMQDETRGEAWIANTASSFLPYSSLISQTASEADPYMRVAKTMIDGFKYRIPGLRDTLLPKLDILGDPIPNPQYGNIIRQSPVLTDPIIQELHDANIHLAPPIDKVAGDVKLPPGLYQEYQIKAGALLKAQIGAVISQPGWAKLPQFVREDALRHIISTVRRVAAIQVMAQHHQIVWQGLHQKLNEIRGAPPPPPLRDGP